MGLGGMISLLVTGGGGVGLSIGGCLQTVSLELVINAARCKKKKVTLLEEATFCTI